MTKTELQIAIARAKQTDKRTAGVFLDTLSNLAYKAGSVHLVTGSFPFPKSSNLLSPRAKALNR
jgi:hypothetical protein